MLAVLDRFLALSGEEKQNFILGRRWGIYRRMLHETRYMRVQEAVDRLVREGKLEQTIVSLKSRMI